jgi:hypothetical protein
MDELANQIYKNLIQVCHGLRTANALLKVNDVSFHFKRNHRKTYLLPNKSWLTETVPPDIVWLVVAADLNHDLHKLKSRREYHPFQMGS